MLSVEKCFKDVFLVGCCCLITCSFVEPFFFTRELCCYFEHGLCKQLFLDLLHELGEERNQSIPYGENKHVRQKLRFPLKLPSETSGTSSAGVCRWSICSHVISLHKNTQLPTEVQQPPPPQFLHLHLISPLVAFRLPTTSQQLDHLSGLPPPPAPAPAPMEVPVKALVFSFHWNESEKEADLLVIGMNDLVVPSRNSPIYHHSLSLSFSLSPTLSLSF